MQRAHKHIQDTVVEGRQTNYFHVQQRTPLALRVYYNIDGVPPVGIILPATYPHGPPYIYFDYDVCTSKREVLHAPCISESGQLHYFQTGCVGGLRHMVMAIYVELLEIRSQVD